MSITSVANGTQTAVISTIHTLTTQTTAGVYVLVVDTTNMANGDIIELAINTKVLSGSDSHNAYSASYTNIQSSPVKYSIPVPIDVEIVCTLTQTAGTGRDFDWSLLKS